MEPLFCQFPTFFVVEDLAAGRLLRVLDDFCEAPEPVWVVYPPRRYLVPKVRELLDRLEAGLMNAIS